MLLLLPQAIVDGFLIGGIYVTIAIGFSLAYGVMHIIDFAVGEWIMLGAFLGFYLNTWTQWDPLFLLPFVFIVFAVIGFVFQPVIHRVLSGKKGNPLLMGLVFTFGLGLMFRGLGLTVFGFYSHSIPSALSANSFSIESGNFFLTIPVIRFAGLVYALSITIMLHYLLKKSDFGLAVRALSQNRDAAGLMGVNAKRTGSYVYGIYVGISAMSGVLIGCIFSISAQMGGDYTIFSFFVVVLAGMGYLSGVPWAAFLLGFVQSFFLIYFNPSYTLLAVFAILYLVLLVSPKGLFAKGV
ncbi:MAG: branched-chain amino acid ABC transporter permease [Desulfobacteraceae bacterium IS3]|nr:MAG: branched-chain amino acid ABC transporter permease [Desulfobacteraceae bacterium IS3]